MESNRFAQFVREFRTRNRWSQEELQQKLKITRVQYVHKLEKGKVRKPSPEFLRAFATLSNRPIEDLQAMLGVEALAAEDAAAGVAPRKGVDKRNPEKYHVVFGHTIWAAPLALAVLRGELDQRFQFASFARAVEKTSSDITNEPDEALSELRDRLIWATRKSLNQAADSPRSPEIETLSAREVRQLLKRKKVHVIAAPGELLAEQRAFLRVATLVDSAVGCVLVHRCSNLPAGNASITTERLAECVRELVDLSKAKPNSAVRGKTRRHDSRTVASNPDTCLFDDQELALIRRDGVKAFCLAAEDETLAAVYADEIAEHLHGKDSPALRDFRSQIDTGYLHLKPLPDLAKEFVKDGRVLLGVVAWEPQTSWAQDGTNWQRVLLQRTAGDGPPEHVTFELAVLGTTNWPPEFRAAFDDLLMEVWTCVEEIGTLHERTADRQTLWWLAKYYGYTTAESPAKMSQADVQRLVRAISEIRFHVCADLLNYRKLVPERY